MSLNNFGDGSYIRLAPNKLLDLPKSGWTFGGWINQHPPPSNGSYLISTANYSVNSSFNCWRSVNNLQHEIEDENGTRFIIGTLSNVFATANRNVWRHLIYTKRGDECIGIYTGAVVSRISSTNAAFDNLFSAKPWTFGARNDLQVDRDNDCDFAHWAKWNRSLTDAEMAALAQGLNPADLSHDLVWHAPWTDSYEVTGGLILETNGVTIADNPPVGPPSFRPPAYEIWQEAAAAGVTVNVALGSWNWTAPQADITLGRSVESALGAWNWTAPQATITVDTGEVVNAALGSWLWSGLTATVSADRSIEAALGQWSWSGLQASVTVSAEVEAALGSWTWTGLQATVDVVSDLVIVDAALGSWLWTGLQAEITGPPSGGGASLSLAQQRRLERRQILEMIRQDDEVVVLLLDQMMRSRRGR